MKYTSFPPEYWLALNPVGWGQGWSQGWGQEEGCGERCGSPCPLRVTRDPPPRLPAVWETQYTSAGEGGEEAVEVSVQASSVAVNRHSTPLCTVVIEECQECGYYGSGRGAIAFGFCNTSQPERELLMIHDTYNIYMALHLHMAIQSVSHHRMRVSATQ